MKRTLTFAILLVALTIGTRTAGAIVIPITSGAASGTCLADPLGLGCPVGFEAIDIAPNPVWAPAPAGATWVSSVAGSGLIGGLVPGGAVVSFFQDFTIPVGHFVTSFTLTVFGADFVNVFVTPNPGAFTNIFTTVVSPGPACNSLAIGCTVGTGKTFVAGDFPAFALGAGTHTLKFEVTQFTVPQGGPGAFGLAFGGAITTVIPEPSAVVLMGAGLLALAAFQRRRANRK